MELIVANQGYLFLIYVLIGIVIAIIFDVFRALRKSFKTGDFITYIEDTVFWIISGIITLYAIFKFNNGEVRAYIFIAIIIGSLVYLLTISKYFMSICVSIIGFAKQLIGVIIIKPIEVFLNLIKKILKPIIKKFDINILKIQQKIKINVKKCKKNSKKTVQKEDF